MSEDSLGDSNAQNTSQDESEIEEQDKGESQETLIRGNSIENVNRSTPNPINFEDVLNQLLQRQESFLSSFTNRQQQVEESLDRFIKYQTDSNEQFRKEVQRNDHFENKLDELRSHLKKNQTVGGDEDPAIIYNTASDREAGDIAAAPSLVKLRDSGGFSLERPSLDLNSGLYLGTLTDESSRQCARSLEGATHASIGTRSGVGNKEYRVLNNKGYEVPDKTRKVLEEERRNFEGTGVRPKRVTYRRNEQEAEGAHSLNYLSLNQGDYSPDEEVTFRNAPRKQDRLEPKLTSNSRMLDPSNVRSCSNLEFSVAGVTRNWPDQSDRPRHHPVFALEGRTVDPSHVTNEASGWATTLASKFSFPTRNENFSTKNDSSQFSLKHDESAGLPLGQSADVYLPNTLHSFELNRNKSENTSVIYSTPSMFARASELSQPCLSSVVHERVKEPISVMSTPDDANQNVATTVIKIFSTTSSDSLGKRMPPKPPPKPKKQPPTTPSSNPMSIKPKPSLEPNIHTSKPNRAEKRRDVTKHKIMKKRSVDSLEAKLRELPNELQTEVSTKLVLIHRRTSKDSIWNITFTKILEESQNIKRQNIMQAKAAAENCDRLMQEISKRERECKIFKEDIHRDKTITKRQLRELHETVCELEYRRNLAEIENRNLIAKLHELEDRHKLTENDNRNLLAKLKKSEVEVEGLLLLNKRKEQEVYEKVSIIEKLEGQATHSEIKLKAMEAEFRDTRDKLIEKELALTETTTKLKETQGRLTETKAKLHEFETMLTVAQKGTGNMGSDDVETTFLDLKQDLEKERKVWTEERKQLMKQAQELQEESLDVKVTLFELKQQLEEERKVWGKEREQLIKQTQEMQKELPAEIQDKYKSDLVLIETITKKSGKTTNKLGIKIKFLAREENTAIRGMAILDRELFVVRAGSSTAEIYDSNNFSFNRRWSLMELINPMDIGSCKRNICLYIFTRARSIKVHSGHSNEILKVDPNGKLINKWSTGHDWGWDMSVTDESNVILTVTEKNKLNEYSPDGQLIREIKLSSDAGFSYPWHAIKLTNGHFLVSHGGVDDALHRVCVLDADGNLKKSFGGKCGSAIGQINLPVYLSVDGNGFVMVVDQLNRRVLLLDSDLKFKREILSREEKYGLRIPWNILLDESNGRLLVADNDMNKRILIFEFR